ncbi:MAG TPA: hypothetical protein ENK26_07960 [Gammaproteobacteria bacterium]|nr:hypothetical protein [Gammaproteobacteria bacterium]
MNKNTIHLAPVGGYPAAYRQFGSSSLWIGILLMIIGAIGIFFPQLLALEAVVLIAILFLAGGGFWLINSIAYHRGWTAWIKPLLLLISGAAMLWYPMSGVAAIGLLLSIYLLLDAFGSFVLAHELHPLKGWGFMAFNGAVSLLLAFLFLIGWPATSAWLVGVYLGVSLLFDGLALTFIGWTFRKLSSE